jgi:hypothetical protein
MIAPFHVVLGEKKNRFSSFDAYRPTRVEREIDELVAYICTPRAAGLVDLSRSSGGYAVRVDWMNIPFVRRKNGSKEQLNGPTRVERKLSLLDMQIVQTIDRRCTPVLRACCTFRGRREVMQYVRVNIPCVRRKNLSA